MEKGKIYKHTNCKDVCFKVRKIKVTNEGYTVGGIWINHRLSKPAMITGDFIKITKDQIRNWLEFDPYTKTYYSGRRPI